MKKILIGILVSLLLTGCFLIEDNIDKQDSNLSNRKTDEISIMGTEVINHQVDFRVTPTINNKNIASTNDINYTVKETFTVQDPTNGITYFTEFPDTCQLIGFRVQSIGCTGLVNIIWKDWDSPMNDYSGISNNVPVSPAGFWGSWDTETILTNNWEVGIIFNGIDVYAVTNRIKITIEGYLL